MSNTKKAVPMYDRRRLERLVMQHKMRVLLQQRKAAHAAGAALIERREES
ncbi:MAG: hypothetical protein IIW40_00700 [Clostridia bacterium]|nr:hypothetical protein [Clostridia bacterium]